MSKFGVLGAALAAAAIATAGSEKSAEGVFTDYTLGRPFQGMVGECPDDTPETMRLPLTCNFDLRGNANGAIDIARLIEHRVKNAVTPEDGGDIGDGGVEAGM